MPPPGRGGGRGRGRGRGRGTRAGGGQAHVPGWAADAGPANTGKGAPGAGRAEKNRMYRHPLPLLDVPPADAAVFARIDARAHTQSGGVWARLARWWHGSAAPKDDINPVVGTYDALTRSVWVTDPAGAAILWRRGFFGKGSLSRSEPTHLARREHTRRVLAERAAAAAAGQPVILTAEELTAVRRRERLQAKIERARAAVRAGTQRADGVLSLGGELTEEDIEALKAAGGILSTEGDGGHILHIDESLTFAEADFDEEDDTYRTAVPGLIYFRGGEDAQTAVEARTRARAQAGLEADPTAVPPPKSSTPPPTAQDAPHAPPTENEAQGLSALAVPPTGAASDTVEAVPVHRKQQEEEPLEEVEWVQLSMIETFFLSVMLGALVVVHEGKPCSPTQVMDLCLSATASPSVLSPSVDVDAQSEWWRRPDNPFLVNYVAYHHYRSLGWCVKPGTKFCVDFLLYKRGPVFGHAEYVPCPTPCSHVDFPTISRCNTDMWMRRFAILVIPSYEDDMERESSPFVNSSAGPMDWVRFSSVNRVNTQVLKTLILCHVHVPSIARAQADGQLESPQALVQAIKMGASYAVHDTAVRRWVPARMKP